MMGAFAARSIRAVSTLAPTDNGQRSHQARLTLTFGATLVDAGAANEAVIHDCEDTLAANPHAMSVLDLAVVEHRSPVELDAPPVNGPRKGNLIGMEILPTRSPHDIIWLVAKYVGDRSRRIQDSCIRREVWLVLSNKAKADRGRRQEHTVDGYEGGLHDDQVNSIGLE